MTRTMEYGTVAQRGPRLGDPATRRTRATSAGRPVTRILAIDPGPTASAYTLIGHATCEPLAIGKLPNDEMLDIVAISAVDRLAVEMVSSHGMAVGAEVFETCVWIGRFIQHRLDLRASLTVCQLVYRSAVRWHHCHSRKARDPNVAQALIDRFAPGERNRGKGTKAAPGWFHGFRADIWQAYALAVYVADTWEPEGIDTTRVRMHDVSGGRGEIVGLL